MQLLCLLAENIYLMMENLGLEYTLFKMLMVRVNYTAFSPYSFIRIKLVKEITFFVNTVTKHANSVTCS